MRLLFGVSKGSWRHTRTILLRAGEDAAVDYLEGCIHVCPNENTSWGYISPSRNIRRRILNHILSHSAADSGLYHCIDPNTLYLERE